VEQQTIPADKPAAEADLIITHEKNRLPGVCINIIPCVISMPGEELAGHYCCPVLFE